jgi:hypothetical protein
MIRVRVVPSYEPSAYGVSVTAKEPSYSPLSRHSVTWGMMRPKPAPQAWPWADWLLLAGMAAMVLWSAAR